MLFKNFSQMYKKPDKQISHSLESELRMGFESSPGTQSNTNEFNRNISLNSHCGKKNDIESQYLDGVAIFSCLNVIKSPRHYNFYAFLL